MAWFFYIILKLIAAVPLLRRTGFCEAYKNALLQQGHSVTTLSSSAEALFALVGTKCRLAFVKFFFYSIIIPTLASTAKAKLLMTSMGSRGSRALPSRFHIPRMCSTKRGRVTTYSRFHTDVNVSAV